MRKKVLIIGIFLAVFGAAWGALYLMRGIEEPALEQRLRRSGRSATRYIRMRRKTWLPGAGRKIKSFAR